MTNEEIDAKIKTLQGMLAEETDVTTLRTINRCIERLVMMDPSDSKED